MILINYKSILFYLANSLTISDYNSMGCFQDQDGTGRAIYPGPLYRDDQNSIEMCFINCLYASDVNTVYVGVEAGLVYKNILNCLFTDL